MVGFEQGLYTAGEAQELLNVCAVLSGETERGVAVRITTVPGTAQGKRSYNNCRMLDVYTFVCSDEDYTFTSVELMFTPMDPVQCTNISILNDSIVEADELFTLQLSAVSPRVEITDNTTTVIIQDDDSKLRIGTDMWVCVIILYHVAVELSVLQSSYTLDEGDNEDICVILNGLLERNLAATLTTMEGTATGQIT